MSTDNRTPISGTGPGTGRAAANFSQSAHAIAQAHAAKLESTTLTPKPAHKHDSRLIQKPGSQHALPRTLWGVVTGAFWLAYLYLWTPVVTLVLWLLGIRSVATELYLRTHEVDPFLMLALPATAGVVVAMLLIWAEYNRWRFASAGSERRGLQPSVSLEQVAIGLGTDNDVAIALNAGRVSVLHMDPNHAVPLSVTELTPELPAQPFPPLAMPKFTRQDSTANNGWLMAVAMASIALVIGVLIVVSHGYRQIESAAPMQAIEGTPGMDRPGLEPAQIPNDEIVGGSSTIDGASVAKIAAATAAKTAAAAETARIAKARAAAERARRVVVAGNSAKPRPLPGYSPKPPYPIEALRHREGGLVNLRVQVSAAGLPLKVEIGKRSGNRALDRSAVSTVRRWRFEPARRDGKAVAAVVIVPVEFKPRN